MSAKSKAAAPAVIEPEPETDTPSAIIERRVTHTETSLMFAPETTFEEWQEAYAFYDRLHERGKWWLGDAIKYAEGRFPDRYTQAIEITGLSYSRLTTIVSVCGKIEPARRRKELPFAMHELIAYIPYQKGDYLLDRAIKEHWTRDELADAVAKSQGEPTRAEKAAAKLAKKGGAVKVLPQTANPDLPIIDIQTTTTPIEKYVWNGFPITVRDGKLIAGEALPDEEAERCAHHFKFPSAKVMMMNFAESPSPEAPAQPSSPPEPAPVTPQPTETPAPPVAAQGPKPTEIEPDQNLALQMCEANLNRFNESIKAVDWSLVLPLARKRWLKLLCAADDLIDVLQKPVA